MRLWQTQKALDRLEDRLKATEDLCSALSRSSRKLDLEFTELYDKVRHQMSRMAKRYAVDLKDNGLDAPDGGNDGNEPSSDPISEKILARRNRGFLQQ